MDDCGGPGIKLHTRDTDILVTTTLYQQIFIFYRILFCFSLNWVSMTPNQSWAVCQVKAEELVQSTHNIGRFLIMPLAPGPIPAW